MPRTLPQPAHRLIRGFASYYRNAWTHEYIYNCIATLNQLHDWLAERSTEMVDATPEELNEFLAERGQTRAASTVIGEHTRLRGFFKWAAHDPGDGMPYITRNPMLRVPAPKPDRDPDLARVPEAEEWQYRAVLDTCFGRRTRDGRQRALDRRDAAMISMLWWTGIRRVELVRLTYADINWDSQMIHLARTKGRSQTRSRDVWVADEAMRLLERYVHERGEHDGPLFESIGRRHNPAGRQLQPNAVGHMLKRRAAIANKTQQLPEPLNITAHSFRRGYASAWLDAGGQQVTLEDHMGWNHDGRMAGRYTRRSATKLAAAEARSVAEARGARRLRSVG